jgi:hypothetical protein
LRAREFSHSNFLLGARAASEFFHHNIFYNDWYGPRNFVANLRGDIASERAMNFGPRPSIKAKMQGWSRKRNEIKQTTKTKQTKFAAMF